MIVTAKKRNDNELQCELFLLLMEEYIRDLEFQIFEYKVKELLGYEKVEEKVDDPKPIPWITPEEMPPWISPTIRDYGNCPKCGLKLGQVMGYCCPNTNCPTGLGPVMCQSNG